MFQTYNSIVNKLRGTDTSSCEPICICGTKLIRKQANTCYSSSSGIQCDKCGSNINGSNIVYHCNKQNKTKHEYGFDLCEQCGNELELTINISNNFESNFLIIPNELASGRPSKEAFEYQKLCYFVNGINKKTINQFPTSSSVQFNSISNFLQTHNDIKNEYFKFNKYQKSKMDIDVENKENNNNFVEFEGNINSSRFSSVSHFPALIAEIKENTFKYHKELKKAMNLYQQIDCDILNRKTSINNKWNIVGLIDPSKNLSIFDHSLDNKLNTQENDINIMNYHHWIPSIFKVNNNLTKCELLSQIPNLNPYKYSKTLYKLIENLFLYQLPQFENVTNCNLRNIELKVIVKAQDYQLFNCKDNESYFGNLHKEGLYENISAVGLYYYQIDKDINGGELEISSVINVAENDRYKGVTELRKTKIKLNEKMSVVFSNELCYHRVEKLNGNGSRKILAFFLIDPTYKNQPIDARFVVVNWKYHSKYIVLNWLNKQNNNNNNKNDNSNNTNGYEWMLNIIYEYVVGNKQYIQKAIGLYEKCRASYHQRIKYSEYQITSSGQRKYTPMRRHHCNMD